MYAIHTIDAAGPEVIHVYDQEEHEIVTQRKAWNGVFTYVVSSYTQFPGKPGTVSRPFRDGEDVVDQFLFYDNLGRLQLKEYADGTSYRTFYSPRTDGDLGMVVGIQDPSGYHEEVRDDFDRTVKTTNFPGPVQAVTTYSYGPFSTLKTVSPPKVRIQQPGANLSSDSSYIYDVLGRRTDAFDPDSGHGIRSFNGFGEVVKATDGNGEATMYTIDALGRTTQVANQVRDHGSSTFTWDTAPHGVGKLGSSTSPDGVVKAFTYDANSRVTAVTRTIPGAGSFTVGSSYDALGRVSEVDYPPVGGQQLQIGYEFDQTGQISRVKNVATDFTYWSLISRNAANQIDYEFAGSTEFTVRSFDPMRGWLNTVQTDDDDHTLQQITYQHNPNGSVISRIDGLPELGGSATQTFEYDDNDMLKKWTFATLDNASVWTTQYGPNGDGTIGGMTMTGPGASSSQFLYGSVNGIGGPHAVTSSNGKPFGYDGAGNRTADLEGNQTNYTSFGLPSSIGEGAQIVRLAYDADHVRTTKTWLDKGQVVSKNVYVGEEYEQRQEPVNGTTHVFYIHGPDRIIGQETWIQNGQGVQQQEALYFHPDILGSVDAISNRSGTQRVHAWYDPFGRRITTQDPTFGYQPIGSVTLGFTGQQMDDDLGLINMKGRMFDPSTGRFLTADPNTQAPFDSAGYDHYAYARNNPLKFVDPSGFLYGADGSDSNPFGPYADFFAASDAYFGSGHMPSAGGFELQAVDQHINELAAAMVYQQSYSDQGYGPSGEQTGGFQLEVPRKDTSQWLADNSKPGDTRSDASAADPSAHPIPPSWLERVFLHQPTRTGGYWDRVSNDFWFANRAIPGTLAPPGLGTALGAPGTIGQLLGLPTFGAIGGSMYGGAVGVGGAVDALGGSFSLTLRAGLAGAGAGFAEVGAWSAVGGAAVVSGYAFIGVGACWELGLGAGALVTGLFH
jgi:RHS repeat-associated protein